MQTFENEDIELPKVDLDDSLHSEQKHERDLLNFPKDAPIPSATPVFLDDQSGFQKVLAHEISKEVNFLQGWKRWMFKTMDFVDDDVRSLFINTGLGN